MKLKRKTKLKIKHKAKPKPKAYSYDPYVDGVTQSMLVDWMLCPLKAKHRYIDGLVPIGVSKPLIFGSIMHEALDIGRNLQRAGKDPRKVDCCREALLNWQKENIDAATEAKDFANDIAKIVKHISRAYFCWYKDEAGTSWEGIEEEFDHEVLDQVRFRGKFDARVYNESTGNKVLLETKTRSFPTTELPDILQRDFQLQSYLAVLSMRGDEHLEAVYDIVKKPLLRQKVDESFSEFGQRVGEDIAKRPEFYFQRINLSFTHEDIARFVCRLEITISRFLAWYRNPVQLFYHPQCEGKFGACSYLSRCLRPEDSGPYQAKERPFSELSN